MEIVYLQEDPTNHVIASVHVILSVAAQAARLANTAELGSTEAEQYLLSYGDNLQRFISGEVDTLDLYIFLDVPANSDLISDPAFAEVQSMVTQAGENTYELNKFTAANFYTADASRTSASTISRIVFTSSNVQIHRIP